MARKTLLAAAATTVALLSSTGAVAVAAPSAPSPAPSPQVTCGSGQVCIYPQKNRAGTPYVRRATDPSTSLPEPINDDTYSIVNNGTGNRTVRIYRASNYTGSYTCIQPGGHIDDLEGYAVGHYGSSIKLNNDRCG